MRVFVIAVRIKLLFVFTEEKLKLIRTEFTVYLLLKMRSNFSTSVRITLKFEILNCRSQLEIDSSKPQTNRWRLDTKRGLLRHGSRDIPNTVGRGDTMQTKHRASPPNVSAVFSLTCSPAVPRHTQPVVLLRHLERGVFGERGLVSGSQIHT